MGCVIRYAEVDPRSIFNLTSPRYLPEVSLRWTGRWPWHHPIYEPIRDMMEREYIRRFDEANGHFAKLLRSIEAEGIRNPVILTCGKLERRVGEEIPPGWRRSDACISEHLGGSRIWAARKLGVKLPAIINDHTGKLGFGEELHSIEEVLSKFTDMPARAQMRKSGSIDLNYMLSGEELQKQCETRRAIVQEIRRMVIGQLARMEMV